MFYSRPLDGFQMSLKRFTSRGQTRDEEAAVQWAFHFENFLALMVRAQCSTFLPVFAHTWTKCTPQLLHSGEAMPHENHLLLALCI